jgi:translation initiation factor 4E
MHPLETAWTLYYQGLQSDAADYSLTIHKIGQFNTVEDFWSYFSHLKRVAEIADPMEYHLFREDIRGMWEDEVNRTAGSEIGCGRMTRRELRLADYHTFALIVISTVEG